MTQSTQKRNVLQASMAMLTLAGGAVLSLVPATVLIVSSRIFTLEQQGQIAVGVMFATFCGQLAAGAIVETRLSQSKNSGDSIGVPRWLLILAATASLAVILSNSNVLVLLIALPLLLAAMEVGRAASVAEQKDLGELFASATIGMGVLGSLGLAFANETWALWPISVAIVLATWMRAKSLPRSSHSVDRRVLAWILLDTSFIGIVFPLLNALILFYLGPSAAVGFAAISTVSGFVGIPLSFMRMRLLKSHTVIDIAVSVIAVAAAFLAIVAAQLFGLLALLFGATFSNNDLLIPLLLACAWRATALWTTIPFAALRRGGLVKLVTFTRMAAVVITFALALLSLWFENLAIVFLALLCGEILQALMYEIAQRKYLATNEPRQFKRET